MIRKKIINSIFLLIILFSSNIYSQPKFEKPGITVLRQELALLIDSLITPPANCEEALELVIFDSLKNDFIYSSSLESRDNRIQNLVDELSSSLKKLKSSNLQMSQVPTGNGPPRGGKPPPGVDPPGGMTIPDDFQDMNEDMEDVNIAVDKIIVLREKIKNELTLMQNKVNEKLHKTLETDYDLRIVIINDFMNSTLSLYNRNEPVFKESMKKIDEVIKKYDYASKSKMVLLKEEFLEFQLEEAVSLKLLMNITKEFASIGAKFYNERQKNLN
ncbi:MAG: hypothetical protein M3R36_12380 [Bacteroidota bacterium]|nr:hypothetical protein [Bacteroidota bacterium]